MTHHFKAICRQCGELTPLTTYEKAQAVKRQHQKETMPQHRAYVEVINP